VAEEQKILKEAYRSYFSFHPSFDILGLSGDISHESLSAALAGQRPDVLVLGLNSANMTMGSSLESIKALCPDVGLVLLFALYDSQGIRVLREFSNNANGGYAYLLKHNIDTADQLGQVVSAVAQGRIIVDPEIMEELVDITTTENKMLAAL
jgi:DNA-binding NarL/FixJ family response regulator